MKFTILNNQLSIALKFSQNIFSNNISSNSSLNSILISVNENIVEITSTNGNISGKFIIKNNLKIIRTGKVVVKGKLLTNIISKIKEKEIELEEIDNVLKISTSNYSFNINTMQVDIFPVINFDTKDWKKIVLENDLIIKGVKKVQNSVAPITSFEKINKLNGILFDSETENGFLRIVATDSFKLAIKKTSLKEKSNFKFLIPNNTINQVVNFLKINDKVALYKSNKNLIIETNDFVLSCTSIDFSFPNIETLLEVKGITSFDVDLNKIINSLERILILVSNDNLIGATLKVFKTHIEFVCNNSELGNLNEKIEITNFKGEETLIKFNPKFLLDQVKSFDNNKISFVLNGSQNPFYLIDQKEKGFLQILVPLADL